MFEVSWGELVVVTGIGLTLIGKRDLPKAANFLGTQIGRVVGLLQGARVRADRYTQNNELRQLQNELKSGLRELDAVKSELAVSMSMGSRGGSLGTMVPSANNIQQQQQQQVTTNQQAAVTSTIIKPQPPFMTSSSSSIPAGVTGGATIGSSSTASPPPGGTAQPQQQRQQQQILPPESQTIGAVAEEEWERQGIQFVSRAERGTAAPEIPSAASSTTGGEGSTSTSSSSPYGSILLANLMKQTLIFDQYDRVVNEQDQILQSKMNQILQNQDQQKQEKKKK